MTFDIDNLRIGVIGLGYVGLPLAVEFGEEVPDRGLRRERARIAELESGTDSTLEVSDEALAAAEQLTFSDDTATLADCNFYVVTVPTPVSKDHRPLLTPLEGAVRRLPAYSEQATSSSTNRRCIPGLPRSSVFRSSRSDRV